MGPLWKGRFHSTVIEDNSYLLGCSLYVDLNAFAAAISQSLEDYDYTSAKIRLDMLRAIQSAKNGQSDQGESKGSEEHNAHDSMKEEKKPIPRISKGEFLSAIKLNTMSDDPELHTQGFRCSDKGFLDYSIEEYLEVLEWCIKNKITEPKSQLPTQVPLLLGQHPLGVELVTKQAREFDSMYRCLVLPEVA